MRLSLSVGGPSGSGLSVGGLFVGFPGLDCPRSAPRSWGYRRTFLSLVSPVPMLRPRSAPSRRDCNPQLELESYVKLKFYFTLTGNAGQHAELGHSAGTPVRALSRHSRSGTQPAFPFGHSAGIPVQALSRHSRSGTQPA